MFQIFHSSCNLSVAPHITRIRYVILRGSVAKRDRVVV